jgi:homoserine O-acetyltransferase
MSTLPRPTPVEGSYTLRDFTFESGETLKELRLGYVKYGTLNAARNNLCLVMPGTSNLRHGTADHVGPGRAYDTDRYCVVCTDSIGGGTSSQPADGLYDAFPRYTIRDMARAQHQLATEGLGLGTQQVALLAGASMGAFQTLEWLIHFPDSVKDAVLLVPAWKAGNTFLMATQRMFDIIALDPDWQDGHYYKQAPVLEPKAGQRAAGRHYFTWTVTDDYLETTDLKTLETEAERAGNGFASWDATSLIYRYRASSGHDVSKPFGGELKKALGQIKARVLVLPCSQDRLLGLNNARELAQGIKGAHYVEIDSNKGHLAWRPTVGTIETDTISLAVHKFLSPMTLHLQT